MQTATPPVDEFFKYFCFKKETNAYSKHKCVSQMPCMVNPILNKQSFGGCSRYFNGFNHRL